MAVAAIAASLLLTRQREERETSNVVPLGKPQPQTVKLDAIRAAGL